GVPHQRLPPAACAACPEPSQIRSVSALPCLPSPRRRGLPPAFWPDRPAPPVSCGAVSPLPCRVGVPAFPAPAGACLPPGRSHARPQRAPAVPHVQLAWLHCHSLGTDD